MAPEDWLAAVEAGYEVGFSIPAEELPARDGLERGDERHQAFVAGLDSGRAARVEADAVEAEHREFFTAHVQPVVRQVVADMNRRGASPAQTDAIRRARAAELGEANRKAGRPLIEPTAAPCARRGAPAQRYAPESRGITL